MSSYGMNSQRGVSYDPSTASKERTEAMIRASRPAQDETPEPAYGRLDGSRKDLGRYLDEVELEYRRRKRSRRRTH